MRTANPLAIVIYDSLGKTQNVSRKNHIGIDRIEVASTQGFRQSQYCGAFRLGGFNSRKQWLRCGAKPEKPIIMVTI
jgi:hypothetical protein